MGPAPGRIIPCRANCNTKRAAARLLRLLGRLIQTAIGDPLARMLIGGEVVDGATVHVDRGDMGLVLTPA